ncbi:hypothetical protein Q3G72_029138 [Acer saccharum]|nr:hypothetical protein Q3G72_029138 [Acer saccharum]
MSLSSCPSSSSSSLRVRASFDTQQRLSYNHNAPKNPKKNLASTAKPPPPPPLTLTTTRLDPSVFDLLKRPGQDAGVKANLDESYMGYDVWLPDAPKVQKPRSVVNAAALAYIGDCIYELYARRHFLFPALSIEEYNDRVTAVVCCEAQDTLLQKLLEDDYLSTQERLVKDPILFMGSVYCFGVIGHSSM